MPFLKGMCPYYISIFHLFHQTGFYTIYFLPPVTLCFIQLPCKCIFKSCKRRNKAVAYQQNQFIYFCNAFHASSKVRLNCPITPVRYISLVSAILKSALANIVRQLLKLSSFFINHYTILFYLLF